MCCAFLSLRWICLWGTIDSTIGDPNDHKKLQILKLGPKNRLTLGSWLSQTLEQIWDREECRSAEPQKPFCPTKGGSRARHLQIKFWGLLSSCCVPVIQQEDSQGSQDAYLPASVLCLSQAMTSYNIPLTPFSLPQRSLCFFSHRWLGLVLRFCFFKTPVRITLWRRHSHCPFPNGMKCYQRPAHTCSGTCVANESLRPAFAWAPFSEHLCLFKNLFTVKGKKCLKASY